MRFYFLLALTLGFTTAFSQQRDSRSFQYCFVPKIIEWRVPPSGSSGKVVYTISVENFDNRNIKNLTFRVTPSAGLTSLGSRLFISRGGPARQGAMVEYIYHNIDSTYEILNVSQDFFGSSDRVKLYFNLVGITQYETSPPIEFYRANTKSVLELVALERVCNPPPPPGSVATYARIESALRFHGIVPNEDARQLVIALNPDLSTKDSVLENYALKMPVAPPIPRGQRSTIRKLYKSALRHNHKLDSSFQAEASIFIKEWSRQMDQINKGYMLAGRHEGEDLIEKFEETAEALGFIKSKMCNVGSLITRAMLNDLRILNDYTFNHGSITAAEWTRSTVIVDELYSMARTIAGNQVARNKSQAFHWKSGIDPEKFYASISGPNSLETPDPNDRIEGDEIPWYTAVLNFFSGKRLKNNGEVIVNAVAWYVPKEKEALAINQCRCDTDGIYKLLNKYDTINYPREAIVVKKARYYVYSRAPALTDGRSFETMASTASIVLPPARFIFWAESNQNNQGRFSIDNAVSCQSSTALPTGNKKVTLYIKVFELP